MKASWSTPGDGGQSLTGFGLKFWTGSEPSYSNVDVVGPHARSKTYSGLNWDTLYKFRVHACNGTDSCGYWTNPPKQVTTPPEPRRPPPAPSSFRVTEHHKTAIKLVWDSLSGVKKYRVGGHSDNIRGTSYTATGLECGTNYTFSLRGYGNGKKYSEEWGAKATVSTSTRACIEPPPAPSGFGETEDTTTSITLSWTALSGITKYEIEDQADDIAISNTSYKVMGLTACTTHTFKLRAFGNGSTYQARWGAWATTSATTDGCPTMDDQSFSVSETVDVGDAVGTVTATAFADGALTYEITAGNDDAHFAINLSTGAITTTAALDYETTTSYSLTVQVSEADGGTATATVTITVTDVSIDYDADGNGLIEVTNLAQLHAIRWDLDGDGSSTNAGYAAAFREAIAAMGCPTAGCTGYELMAELDFDTDGSGAVGVDDAYWNDGSGWEPIGTSAAKFTATFDGNGKEIANLTIARDSTERVGLFGTSSGVVRRVGLTNVDVEGSNYTGGLVGWNEGSISLSFVTGAVESTGNDAGGLVGWTTGKITTSYSTAAVTGGEVDAGGLVGGSSNSAQAKISDSYSTGPVTGARRAAG